MTPHGMRTVGIAGLLPALFLAALYVAAPFAGTTTHAIARVDQGVAAPAHPATAHRPANLRLVR
ncbi:MAG: hypothetical protein ACJ74O_01205 [Frankiaceae bacterium]